MPSEVIAVGAPIVDHFGYVSDEELASFASSKGGMELIEVDQLQLLKSKCSAESFLGGSAFNTLKTLARLGKTGSAFGLIGQDKAGKFYEESLRSLGIKNYLIKSSRPTGEALCFVTPDGERTMRTFIGASQDIQPDDLSPVIMKNIKLLHIEGYTLYYPGVTRRAMELAKQTGAKISLDLSSFEVVTHFKVEILNLIRDFVDILFCNEKEAEALTTLTNGDTIDRLQYLVPISVVTLGSKGAWVASEGSIIHVPAAVAIPYDTTGAGDLFSGAFLYSYLNGRSLDKCAAFGNLVASKVIQVRGTELTDSVWNELKAFASA